MNFQYWLKTKASEDEKQLWSTEGLDTGRKRDVLCKWMLYKSQGFTVDVKIESAQSVSWDQ